MGERPPERSGRTWTQSTILTLKMRQRLILAGRVGQQRPDGHIITISEVIRDAIKEYCERRGVGSVNHPGNHGP